ncbi:unnamed protein product [Adineta ricciae]|uniref:Chitin-binding type-1 domain-containing protein n=1 Tax=Adineta ricciae TaxID=249248 RepID=A0A813TWX5_ADIRI|nr:unnamed protein product [Adineta ricciae]CAF0974149.1 unnamed protein product [Adineta ricciae]
MHLIQILLVLVIFSFGILYEVEGNQWVNTLKRSVRNKCFCAKSECCSKWGYCGKTDEYCGVGCQSGPCKLSPTQPAKLSTSFTLTADTFACVFPKIDAELRARRFQGLHEAMELMKWKPASSTEAAVFLSHVSHETDGLKTCEEYCSQRGSCNNYQSSWCEIQARPNVKYYGRGWFQLSYPCNYHNAGKALGIDLLKEPGLVSESEKIAAATAIWYYKETGMDKLAQRGDFGETTRKINEYECSGKAGHQMQAARVQTYHQVRKCFNLPPATNSNLIC